MSWAPHNNHNAMLLAQQPNDDATRDGPPLNTINSGNTPSTVTVLTAESLAAAASHGTAATLANPNTAAVSLVYNNNTNPTTPATATTPTSAYHDNAILKEISLLRSRLQDLEDDGKSSTVDVTTATLLTTNKIKGILNNNNLALQSPQQTQTTPLQTPLHTPLPQQPLQQTTPQQTPAQPQLQTAVPPNANITTTTPTMQDNLAQSPLVSTTTTNMAEATPNNTLVLKQQIRQLEDERAQQQVEMMNTIACLSREKQELVDSLQRQLALVKEERNALHLKQEQQRQPPRPNNDATSSTPVLPNLDGTASSSASLSSSSQNNNNNNPVTPATLSTWKQEEAEDEIRRLTLHLRRAEEEISTNTQHISNLLQTTSELTLAKQELEQKHELQLAEFQRHAAITQAQAQAQDALELEQLQDHLQEARDEMQLLQGDLSKAERERDGALEQMGEMNDSYIRLEEQLEEERNRASQEKEILRDELEASWQTKLEEERAKEREQSETEFKQRVEQAETETKERLFKEWKKEQSKQHEQLQLEHEQKVKALLMEWEEEHNQRQEQVQKEHEEKVKSLRTEWEEEQTQKQEQVPEDKVQNLRTEWEKEQTQKQEQLQKEHEEKVQSLQDEIQQLKETNSESTKVSESDPKQEKETTRLTNENTDLKEQVKQQEAVSEKLRKDLQQREYDTQRLREDARQYERDLERLREEAYRSKQDMMQLRDEIISLKDHKQQQRNNHASSSTPSVSADERKVIQEAILQLEDRLKLFQDRLKDKEDRIISLNQQLSGEKQTNRDLESQIRTLKRQQPKTQEDAPSSPNASAILLTPPRVMRSTTPRVPSPQWPPSGASSSNLGSISPSKRSVPTTRQRSKSSPVSRLVASFEEGNISNRPEDDVLNTTIELTESGDSDGSTTIADLRRELQHEREVVSNLEQELQEVKTSQNRTFLSQQKREMEKELERLRQEVSRLEQARDESQSEIEKLQKQLNDSKKATKLASRSAAAPYSNPSSPARRSKSAVSARPPSELAQKLATWEQRANGGANHQKPLSSTSGMTSELEQKLANFGKKSKLFENVERVTNDINSRLEEQIENLTKENDELRRNASSNRNVKELESTLSSKEVELSRLKMQYREAEQRLKDLEEESRLWKLGDRRASLDDLQTQLSVERATVRELQSSLKQATDDSRFQLQDNKREITQLRMQLEACEESKRSLQLQIEQLERKLEDHSKSNNVAESEYVTTLQQQVEALQQELNDTSIKLNEQARELTRLRNAEEDHALARSEFVSTRAGRNTSRSQEEEVHRMTDALTKTQVERGELEMTYMQKLKGLEREMETNEAEAKEHIDELSEQISELEVKLGKQEENVKRLESEKEQLCYNMSFTSQSRSDEFEELQNELFEKTATTNSQAREIQTLKMKVEEFEAEREGQQMQLNRKMSEMEAQMAKAQKDSPDTSERLDRMQKENKSLRESIREVKAERRMLQEKLQNLLDSSGNSSKSTQVLRDRNSALRKEVERLTKRLKKMEDAVTRFAI